MGTTPANILIVDDMPANRLMIERLLDRLGHKTFQAEDGRRALDALRKLPIDLVMLDIMMPVMNGFETLAALKADPQIANIPVVVVSALNDVESIARCITLGAEDFLFKPVDRVLLEARVASCLARKELRDREQAAYTAAAEASAARGRFIALVSHELKSPLTALIGYADLLLREQQQAPAAPGHDYARTIHSLGRQMAGLLEDLNDLSRIESGQLRLDLQPQALDGAIESAVAMVQGLLEARRHRLELHLEAQLPLVQADGMRLTQILTNLLSNACKYTPDGGVISLEARTGEPGMIEVTVRDSGVGIVEAEQVHIFEPFFRSTDPGIRLQPGTGLGLSITRHLVELQGGAIWFSSRPDHGTAFSFSVPQARGQPLDDWPDLAAAPMVGPNEP